MLLRGFQQAPARRLLLRLNTHANTRQFSAAAVSGQMMSVWGYDQKKVEALVNLARKNSKSASEQEKLLKTLELTKENFCEGAAQAYRRVADEFNRVVTKDEPVVNRPQNTSTFDTLFLPTDFDSERTLTFDVTRWALQKDIELLKTAGKSARVDVEDVNCEVLRVDEASSIKCGSWMVRTWMRLQARLFRIILVDVLFTNHERFLVFDRKAGAEAAARDTAAVETKKHVWSFIHLVALDKEKVAKAGSIGKFRTNAWLLFDCNNSHGSL